MLFLNRGDIKPTTLFSWSITKESQQVFTHYQKDLTIHRIFQYVHPNEFYDGSLTAHIQNMNEANTSVFAMDGGHYWGTTDYGYDEMIAFVDQVVSFNMAHESTKLSGIVFDVEPAQDENWETSEEELMKRYVENMVNAYAYASSKGLYVVNCVPFWYDEKHLSELTRLFRDASDELAVMNYYRGKEVENINTEVGLAKKFNKPIITIFEFDRPDNDKVFEQNSYHTQGPYVAFNVFKEIDHYFDYNQLTAGWHQLK